MFSVLSCPATVRVNEPSILEKAIGYTLDATHKNTLKLLTETQVKNFSKQVPTIQGLIRKQIEENGMNGCQLYDFNACKGARSGNLLRPRDQFPRLQFLLPPCDRTSYFCHPCLTRQLFVACKEDL